MAVLPVYNIIAVPGVRIYLQSEYYRSMTGHMPREGEKITLIYTKEKLEKQNLKSDSFYPIGVTGSIDELDNSGFFKVHLRNRVNLDEVVVYPDQSLELSVSVRPEVDDLDRELASVHLSRLKAEVIRFSENYQWGEMIRAYASRWTSTADIAAAMSPWIINENEERYAILAEDSLAARNEMLEKMIYENLEITRISSDARTAKEEDYQKMYRESAIKRQMEMLQNEMDELHPENVSDIRRLEIKLEETPMNDEAKREGKKVLNRLKSEGGNGTEAGMLTDYLDLLTSLPWEKEPAHETDLEFARKILEEDHFGLEKVKRRIIQQIAVMNLKKTQAGSIILFVGAPGTGKTSIGKSIARALGREYVRVALGGVRDEADIRGHRRTYIGSMPGRIIDGIEKAGVSNPVMVLDEVDKLSMSYNGDPASALLEVLDPEQNNTFTDHYLNVPYDLSDVLFVCTANSVETIPEPLLNRMEVIDFRGYTPIEKREIAKRHLIKRSKNDTGIGEEDLVIPDEIINKLIEEYTREAGVRGLKKRIDTLCRSAAVRIVEGEELPITVREEELYDYLDMNPIHQKRVKDETAPGIVTGLAWTGAGGDVLYIESMFTRGRGEVSVTGQLGDVMKESAMIAKSLVKSFFPEKAKLFGKRDLHIHVPDGATPKDGPSAGVTLTTALASLVSQVPIPPSVAMTGEVSLQGDVNPIGGLPEKLMAAQRAGVKKVFIPYENRQDLNEVSEEVKSELSIVPVRQVREILTELKILAA